MKKLILVTILASALTGVFIYQNYIHKRLTRLADETALIDSHELLSYITAKQEILLPEPLKGALTFSQSKLTVDGVIEWTNHHRERDRLTPVRENALLTAAANVKLDDLIDREYFAHVSPIGVGPADVIADAGYHFLLSGENLALGSFKDDQVLVQAWMNSPGHRANILKPGFREIGVAIGQGKFEGRTTWFSVQMFGTAFSVCEQPDEELFAEIEEYNEELVGLEDDISLERRTIDDPYASDENRQDAVYEHNALAEEYNELGKLTRELAGEYNSRVKEYNQCLEEYK